MEQALAAAEQALPQTTSYRLCDYLLLPKAAESLLTEYEQLVLRRGCGRTAARLLLQATAPLNRPQNWCWML